MRNGEAIYKNRLGVKPTTRTPNRYAPKLGKYRSEVRLGLEEARSAVPKPQARKNTVDRRDYIRPEQLKA